MNQRTLVTASALVEYTTLVPVPKDLDRYARKTIPNHALHSEITNGEPRRNIISIESLDLTPFLMMGFLVVEEENHKPDDSFSWEGSISKDLHEGRAEDHHRLDENVATIEEGEGSRVAACYSA